VRAGEWCCALERWIIRQRLLSTTDDARPYNSPVTIDLTGKRVLILGAETEIGRAVTTAVAEAGASVAAIAATSDAEAAFAVQRLARRLSSGERKLIAQAIDATNEAAVRVMVRQVSKELGGIDAVVDSTRLGDPGPVAPPGSSRPHQLILRFGGKEILASGGRFVVVKSAAWEKVSIEVSLGIHRVSFNKEPPQIVAQDVVRAIAGEADSG
jgi:NADPH:quinone reductase-like Zn-dependent oxidoreductase